MKHTKGNWTIKPSPSESSSGWTAIECSDEVIAEVYGSDEESQALASLIASAPEMLDELKMVAIGLKQIHTAWARERVGYVEEIIAKAEGK